MFDTHCHLNFQAFTETFDSVIRDSQNEGVTLMMIPGTDLESSKKSLEIASYYAGTYSAVGFHPTKELESLSLGKVISFLENLCESPYVLAIGEIGLDYYRFRSASRLQKEWFTKQLKLATKLDKSVIVHNRHAADDLIGIVNDNWEQNFEERMVFHCCEPEMILLDYAIKHNIFIGVDGDVTYDKSKQEFVKHIPLELLVVETDSPYIVPEPLRSEKVKINEPKNVRLVLEKLAGLKNIEFDAVVEKTRENGKKLFGIN
jgi:TatD DNase family protein